MKKPDKPDEAGKALADRLIEARNIRWYATYDATTKAEPGITASDPFILLLQLLTEQNAILAEISETLKKGCQ